MTEKRTVGRVERVVVWMLAWALSVGLMVGFAFLVKATVGLFGKE